MISLCPDKSQYIIGPFEFEKIDAYNRIRQKVPAIVGRNYMRNVSDMV